MSNYMIRGRSIDGTVYYAGWGSWTSNVADAGKYTDEPTHTVAKLKKEQRGKDIDDVIGHIEAIRATPDLGLAFAWFTWHRLSGGNECCSYRNHHWYEGTSPSIWMFTANYVVLEGVQCCEAIDFIRS